MITVVNPLVFQFAGGEGGSDQESQTYCQVSLFLLAMYNKNFDIRKFAVIYLKFEQGCFMIMHPNDADRMANSDRSVCPKT